MSLFNRRGKYKEKHARRTLKEYFHKIKGEDSKEAKLPIKKLMWVLVTLDFTESNAEYDDII